MREVAETTSRANTFLTAIDAANSGVIPDQGGDDGCKSQTNGRSMPLPSFVASGASYACEAKTPKFLALTYSETWTGLSSERQTGSGNWTLERGAFFVVCYRCNRYG